MSSLMKKSKFTPKKLFSLTSCPSTTNISSYQNGTNKPTQKQTISSYNKKQHNKTLFNSSKHIKHEEIKMLNSAMSSIENQKKSLSRSVSMNYTPLTQNQKIKVFEDMNQTSNQRLNLYNDIFAQIKSQISQIEISMNTNANDSRLTFNHKKNSDTNSKTKEEKAKKKHFECFSSCLKKKALLIEQNRCSFSNDSNSVSCSETKIDPRSMEENKMVIQLNKNSFAQTNLPDKGNRVVKVFKSNSNCNFFKGNNVRGKSNNDTVLNSHTNTPVVVNNYKNKHEEVKVVDKGEDKHEEKIEDKVDDEDDHHNYPIVNDEEIKNKKKTNKKIRLVYNDKSPYESKSNNSMSNSKSHNHHHHKTPSHSHNINHNHTYDLSNNNNNNNQISQSDPTTKQNHNRNEKLNRRTEIFDTVIPKGNYYLASCNCIIY